MQVTIESATFHISTNQSNDWDSDEEFIGEGMFSFSYRQAKRVLKKLPNLGNLIGDLEMHLAQIEEDYEDNGEELDDATLSIQGSTDEPVALMCAMIHLGGEWEVYYEGTLEYWFWHDLHHAEHDFHCNDGVMTADVDENVERETSLESASTAKEKGVSLGDIARELANIEKAWPARFSTETFLLEDFLN